MTHVLVTTDGSTAARASLSAAARLLKSLNVTQVTVLSVVQPARGALLHADTLAIPQLTWDALSADADELAGSELESATTALAEFDGRVTVIRRHGPRVQRIVEAARYLGVDIIVLGTSGWSGLRALLRLSVANAVVRCAPCPVLVVRQEAGGLPIARLNGRLNAASES